jgi:hypothetical protein
MKRPKREKRKLHSLADEVLSEGIHAIQKQYPSAVTIWEVRNRHYFAFSLSQENAMALRHRCPELKHGRIRNTLQMFPSEIEVEKLYRCDPGGKSRRTPVEG